MSSTDTQTVTNSLGRRIYVLPADPRGAALVAAAGDFNPDSLRIWRKMIGWRAWDLVVDVGANYGEMLLGAQLPEHATVVAFEPDEGVRSCLVASLSDAGLSPDVRSEAVAAVVGESDFVVDPSWSGTSRLAADERPAGLTTTRVRTTTLDAVLGGIGARSACIKIDVEGAEDLVLEGGQTFFRTLDDLAILVEILHRSPADLVEWATRWRMYLFDRRSEELLRVLPGDASDVERLLHHEWVYRQDAVLLPLLDAAS